MLQEQVQAHTPDVVGLLAGPFLLPLVKAVQDDDTAVRFQQAREDGLLRHALATGIELQHIIIRNLQ